LPKVAQQSFRFRKIASEAWLLRIQKQLIICLTFGQIEMHVQMIDSEWTKDPGLKSSGEKVTSLLCTPQGFRRSHIFLYAFLLLNLGLVAQPFPDGFSLLKKMHGTFYKGPCREYSFSQKNTHYHLDTVIGHSEWHEWVSFPDGFRIERGRKENNDYVIFRNDSVYNYRGGKLMRARVDSNTLLLLLGGMYYRTLTDASERLIKGGFDLTKIAKKQWKGMEVFAVGEDDPNLPESVIQKNQFWVDARNLRIIRIIQKINEKDQMDMRFEEFSKWCNGFVETRVSFRRNGMLEQVEEYYDLRTN
jgi:hypothetical protein